MVKPFTSFITNPDTAMRTLVHFHVATLVYLGEVFPGDGYPKIDNSQGGTLDGLLKTLAPWTDNAIKVVPGARKSN